MKKSELIFDGRFGIEKENLRVNYFGELSLEKHPEVFGSRNQYITTDFSESQIEMITPVCNTVDEAYDFLENINNIVMLHLENELLWPGSNPPILPDEDVIPLAVYDDIEKEQYRKYLALKYGKKRAILSGIHFNFSFSDELLRILYEESDKIKTYEDFKDQLYLKVTKYFMKNRWLFIYLFGASPVFHESYMKQCVELSTEKKNGGCTSKGMQSLRNSVCGYRNSDFFFLDYRSYYKYKQSVSRLVDEEKIKQDSELYTAIRIKPLNNHIEYLEFRFLDINPLFATGINQDDLKLIHMFAIYFAQLEDFDYDEEQQVTAGINQDISAQSLPDASLIANSETTENIYSLGLALLNNLNSYIELETINKYSDDRVIQKSIERLKTIEKTYSSILKSSIDEKDYISFHLSQAKYFLEQARDYSFALAGFADMELSTQLLIQSAIKTGLTIDVLDREQNFIRLVNPQDHHAEYIKEATKTSLDKYSQVLVMENKLITKLVLAEHGINVPTGFSIAEKKTAIKLFKQGDLPKELVVKPNTTNFGKGITIFPYEYSEKELIEALDFAFSEDNMVLLERFQSGKEYRILIIGDEVAAVIHRRAANVVGDGMHTIEHLVERKNESVLRGKGYRTPLEYLQLGKSEIDFLAYQQLTIDSRPAKGQRIYLRENSNISTGGDSIDFTDNIHASYKDAALQAAKALDVQICGVDILIEDISKPATPNNYSIIEVNFNPAIHIHCYPYRGTKRNIGDKVIKLLFDNKEKF
ncbi:bifunctional glutamate--cysteine ligase GshA/glutathione synthetase GshB [Culicoidibacter larvae]|uniref:glutamate--cysteine ligase n=1 Tax=Culicoidibacter larvae TaxID=2579976 RepID=A0A5R8QIF6_9FIRM|nr:bifunctional glutamate--cysteine ligase GshA/glutathione synthetase GshB [Culicoidibacter larvae]TLG77223.1 bifunctional glutamate--cysteine ligase GshA/glutathione synthetase GshB [Culicoidibacter larvae]